MAVGPDIADWSLASLVTSTAYQRVTVQAYVVNAGAGSADYIIAPGQNKGLILWARITGAGGTINVATISRLLTFGLFEPIISDATNLGPTDLKAYIIYPGIATVAGKSANDVLGTVINIHVTWTGGASQWGLFADFMP